MLLHKKGSKHDLANWGPIALANTLYEIWTCVIAECLYMYAEHLHILIVQEGFRKQKDKILSDAKVKQDLYLLYVEIRSTFNTIGHNKLLCIMHHLGFPEDAIEVTAKLYTDAKSRMKLFFAGQLKRIQPIDKVQG